MYIKEIKDMIHLMNENNLAELEIEKDGLKIRLKKSSGTGFEKTIEFVPATSGHHGAHQAQASEVPAKTAQAAEKKNVLEIKAPMVGTFYRAPSPETPSYVNIGDQIEPGQIICIIEAMKLMNEIKAEVKGKIIDIQVDNGEPIEFGQVLFVIEPA